MKYLILLTIIFAHGSMCSKSNAQSMVPKSAVGGSTDGMTIHSSKSKCEKQYNEKCVKLGNKPNLPYLKPVPKMVPDRSRPKFKKLQVETCASDSQCQSLLESKSCEKGEAIKVLDTTPKEVYCKARDGLHLKESGEYKAVIDQSAKEAYEQEQAQKRAEKRAKKQEREKLKEIMRIMADELGRDADGKFLKKSKIRQKIKNLK